MLVLKLKSSLFLTVSAFGQFKLILILRTSKCLQGSLDTFFRYNVYGKMALNSVPDIVFNLHLKPRLVLFIINISISTILTCAFELLKQFFTKKRVFRT